MTEQTTIQEHEMTTIELLTDDRPERFDGTPADIVQAMNATAFSPVESSDAYMERFAHYAQLMQGHDIRTGTPAQFLSDLIACGLARIAPRAS